MLLERDKSSLLIIDMQERLMPAMEGAERVTARAQILLKAAQTLELPVCVSEQYPKGLGHTIPDMRTNAANVFEKTEFSCWRNAAIKAHLVALHERQRPQVIVAGVEAHVCVLQTAVDLAQAGFGVFVVADAVTSRSPESVELALQRMSGGGVEIVNTEMAVFELLGRAGTPEFKELSALVR